MHNMLRESQLSQLAGIEGETAQLNLRLAGVEVGFRDLRELVGQQFDGVDTKLRATIERLDARIDRLNDKLDVAAEKIVDKLEVKIERLDAKIDRRRCWLRASRSAPQVRRSAINFWTRPRFIASGARPSSSSCRISSCTRPRRSASA